MNAASIAAAKIAPSRILVIRYRFIGDTILTVPFLKNLRHAFPDAKIDVLVGPQSGEVLRGCPYINELITYDTTRFHKYDRGEGKPRSFWSYVRELRKKNYDTCFVLKRSFSSALLAFLIGSRNRIGYSNNSGFRSIFLTHKANWDPSIHEVESTLKVLEAAGIDTSDRSLEAFVSQNERQEILKLVPELAQSQKRKILFHAAAAHPDKTYPLELWAELIKKLAKEHDILPFFAGSSQDRSDYERLEKLAGLESVNTAGKLSLRQSIALFAELELSICTDSGPAHLSAAAGTPTIAIFGPTDPERWKPWGTAHKAVYDSSLSCRPCNYKKTCDDRRQCLSELSPEFIAKEALELLAKAETAGV